MLGREIVLSYLTKAKNSTISTLDFEREKEGGRTQRERQKEEKVGMAGRW